MKTRNVVVQKLQLLGIAAAIGIGLLVVGMAALAGVSFAASAPRSASAPASALKIGDYVWYDANANGTWRLRMPGRRSTMAGSISSASTSTRI